MDIKNLWDKLFSRKNEAEEIALHVSGATVRHQNPFEDIEVPRNKAEITKEVIDKWVIPFYMKGFVRLNAGDIKAFALAANEIDQNIVANLLGDFNWRTRITASYFAAINNYHDLDEIIGRHLVKSEVCYAGGGYCLALALFNTDTARNYLKKYLNYYLEQPDLWFDQEDVYCALDYADSAEALKYLEQWKKFALTRDSLNLDSHKNYFYKKITAVEAIRKEMTYAK